MDKEPSKGAIERLVAASKAVLSRDINNTCQHEETHRGGVLWEICDLCGAKWADDEGGRPDFVEPKEWGELEAAISAVLPDPETDVLINELRAGSQDAWIKVAKLAGEYGIRFRTNSALVAFLSAIERPGHDR